MRAPLHADPNPTMSEGGNPVDRPTLPGAPWLRGDFPPWGWPSNAERAVLTKPGTPLNFQWSKERGDAEGLVTVPFDGRTFDRAAWPALTLAPLVGSVLGSFGTREVLEVVMPTGAGPLLPNCMVLPGGLDSPGDSMEGYFHLDSKGKTCFTAAEAAKTSAALVASEFLTQVSVGLCGFWCCVALVAACTLRVNSLPTRDARIHCPPRTHRPHPHPQPYTVTCSHTQPHPVSPRPRTPAASSGLASMLFKAQHPAARAPPLPCPTHPHTHFHTVSRCKPR